MKGLSIQNLSSGYNSRTIVKDLSFTVADTETLILMGPSGSGKSTLLLTILGIISPSQGSISLNDRDITNFPIESRNIGYLPQDYGLFPHLNVFGNIGYGLMVRGMSAKEQETRVEEMLDLVDLPGVENKRIQELSGGQKQRVGLARALAIKPALFLLHEFRFNRLSKPVVF